MLNIRKKKHTKWINNRPSVIPQVCFFLSHLCVVVFSPVIIQPWRRLTHSDGPERDRGRWKREGRNKKRIWQPVLKIFHVTGLFSFITIRPFPPDLLSLLHRALSSFALLSSICTLLRPQFSIALIWLITSESPPINRINVFSDAPCHALPPLSLFFWSTEDIFLPFDSALVTVSQVPEREREREKRNP